MMGIERIVHFPDGKLPEWPTIATKYAEFGETPVLRMIDGLPAFPDEIPDPSWHELRVGLAGGMVTLRRDGDTIRCVVWGSNDPILQSVLETSLKAVSQAGQGVMDQR